jgi:predicted transposase YdaD
MSKKADIGSKRLISLAPEQWVKWVTQIPNVQVRDIITSEFQWVSRESDVLVRAYTPEDGEFLVLNELQLRENQGGQDAHPTRVTAFLWGGHPARPILI